MTNEEALSNIGANLGEIVGVMAGVMFLFSALVFRINKYPGNPKRMLMYSGGIFALALVTPIVVNALQMVNMLVSIVVGWSCSIVILAVYLYIYFRPWAIASQQGKKHHVWIKVLNVCFLIPFNWLIALSWASMSESAENQE